MNAIVRDNPKTKDAAPSSMTDCASDDSKTKTPSARAFAAGYAVSAIGIATLAVALGFGAVHGDFFADGGRLVDNPWGLITLIEVYVGIVLFGSWVVFRERCLWVAGLWIAAIAGMGNILACVYVFVSLWRSKGDFTRFWLGKYAPFASQPS